MSSNCSNCYNGCTEIVSDRCVKYTGIDVPVLGIQTGDSLSFVEQALITFLTSTLDGTGIKIDLGDTVVCNLVQQYLPTCGDLTIVDISKALIEAACDLQAQVDAIDADLATLNADYTIGCLTGVTASSDTHAIVQAVINKLCQVQVDLTALALDLSTNYVPINSSPGHPGVNDYIQAYLNSISTSTLVSNKMVPYSVLPYFGPLSNFDGSGAGIGDWLKIYLCNGQNGSPDLRGRTLVGTTTGMFGGPLAPAVDFNIPGSGSPNYILGSVAGANQVSLDIAQVPSHTHIATAVSTVTPESHSHFTVANASSTPLNTINPINANNSTGGNLGYSLQSTLAGTASLGKTNDVTISVATNVSNAPIGGGLGHANIQPSIGSYFIIYLP
jgi:microcystin-dependent protein